MWKAWEGGKHRPRSDYQQIIAAAFGTAAGAIFGAPSSGATPVLRHDALNKSHEVHVNDILDIRNEAQQLIALDTRYGGDDVVSLATRAFRSSYNRMASGIYVPTVEHDLQAAIGELGEVAAWIAYDADQQALARQLTQEAILLSRLAGDRNMELFQLANLSMQSVYLHRPAEARSIADSVLTDHLSPRTAALFHVRRARALAQTGHKASAMAELDHASAILSDGIADHDPAWTWWLDDSEMAWQRAMCLADLDEHTASLDLFHMAYDLRPLQAHRGRFNDLAHLLNAQTTVQAWHEAEQTILSLPPYLTEVRSRRTTALLRQTLRRLSQHHGLPSSLTDATTDLARHLDNS